MSGGVQTRRRFLQILAASPALALGSGQFGPWPAAALPVAGVQGGIVQRVRSKDGTEIAFRRSGSGPPLLLVHGTTADHSRWSRILPVFEQRFTVYAMDRRGRGDSGDAPEYAVAREAEDVAAVVDSIGGSVNVLGHSYGAICSLEAALLTTNVRRLVLYEPPLAFGAPIYPPGLPDRIQALVDRGDREAALLAFFREVVRMPEHELEVMRGMPVWQRRVALAHTLPREMRLDEFHSFDPDKFRALAVPTLLLLGGDSPPIFRKAIEAVDAALPRSQVVVLPGQQHVAMDTAPELFSREVLEYLSEEIALSGLDRQP